MANKKDLFSIFRDNQHLFNSAPSPRAWDKLERRLEGHRSRNRLSFLRTVSMAAAILLLAVVAILVSIAVGEKPSRLFNQSPKPLASEQLQADDIEAAQELRQTLYAQQAEQQRQRPVNEGPADRKLILAKDRSASSALESLNRFDWLEGKWQPQDTKAHPAIHWEKIGSHAIEGLVDRDGATENIRIFQDGETLYFSTDFERKSQVRFPLQYATPGMAVFETTEAGFPKRITITRNRNNRLTLLYEQKHTDPSPGLINRKQQARAWYKIQLQ